MVWILYILAGFLEAAKVILETKRNMAGKAAALISKVNEMDSPAPSGKPLSIYETEITRFQ